MLRVIMAATTLLIKTVQAGPLGPMLAVGIAVLSCVNAARATEKTPTTGPVSITLPGPQSGPEWAKGDRNAVVWMQSSLNRIFPRSEPGDASSHHIVTARNRRVSLQIALQNQSKDPISVNCEVTDPDDLEVRVRRQGFVPAVVTAHTPAEEVDGLAENHVPGLVPDPLHPDTATLAGAYTNVPYWITIRIPESVPPGIRELGFKVTAGSAPDRDAVELKATIDVRPLVVQKRKGFPVTHWWRPNAIWMYYDLEPWSDEWFEAAEAHLRNMVDHGSNMILITAIESRKEYFEQPTQMLKITRNGDKYNFDWSIARRFVRLAKECGMEYFEFPHLWTYWGVKHPMRVYEDVGDKRIPMWSVESDGFSDSYINFLKQYLDSSKQFLEEEGILDRTIFHLSDEPPHDAIPNYKRAREILREIAPWMKVADALSDIRYGKMGICDIPIPQLPGAINYYNEGIPHWVYYCCEPPGEYLNRFYDTPLAKLRMEGFLWYHFKAQGFLHWAYNYWFHMDTEKLLNPFLEGNQGDPFVVYPAKSYKDEPLDSIRWEVFAESLDDYAMLQSAGISPDDPLFAPLKSYKDYPKSPDWITTAIDQVLSREQPQESRVTAGGSAPAMNQ